MGGEGEVGVQKEEENALRKKEDVQGNRKMVCKWRRGRAGLSRGERSL